ncbi:MAG: hypothetical protein Q4F72_12815, partial [Desulfovibrionaceae bacterium]|nr:hypothetical protein [Desulfovibrionaceae bacterium]
MKLTRGAIGNLINRYRAVLTKCRLLNSFGSLAAAAALAAGLALGGTQAALADDLVMEGQTPSSSELSGVTSGDRVIAGWKISQAGTETHDTALATDVTVYSSAGYVGGSLVETGSLGSGDSISLAHGSLSTILNGTSGTGESRQTVQGVAGGSLVMGSGAGTVRATAQDVSLTIQSGIYLGTVIGGSAAIALDGAGSMQTGDRSVTTVISGGNFMSSMQDSGDSGEDAGQTETTDTADSSGT